jgi:hypothetical protein
MFVISTGTIPSWARRRRKRNQMQNAHLRLGRLEYVRHIGGTNTHGWVHVDRYVGDGEQAEMENRLPF